MMFNIYLYIIKKLIKTSLEKVVIDGGDGGKYIISISYTYNFYYFIL